MDRLLTAGFRHNSRRLMRFARPQPSESLPPPDPARGYMLYLHVPFCTVLCPFCSFHRVCFEEQMARRYFQSLRQEIRMAHDAGYLFSDVYVGGGTPTDRYDKYGSAAQVMKRLEGAHGFFETLNADMIFNLPHQDEDSLLRDVDLLTRELEVCQVTFYPLMSAARTMRKMFKTMGTVDFDREGRMYRLILDALPDTYRPSSTWCFNRNTGTVDEYIIENEEYLGLGSGSLSYLDGVLYSSTFSLNHYNRQIEAGRGKALPGLLPHARPRDPGTQAAPCHPRRGPPAGHDALRDAHLDPHHARVLHGRVGLPRPDAPHDQRGARRPRAAGNAPSHAGSAAPGYALTLIATPPPQRKIVPA